MVTVFPCVKVEFRDDSVMAKFSGLTYIDTSFLGVLKIFFIRVHQTLREVYIYMDTTLPED